MSHFTVLVIGPDPERQLQPFHEFECTGINDEFVQDIDITADVAELVASDGLTDALEYHGLEKRIVESESAVDRNDKHMWGWALVRDGQLIKAVKRTNPNKKWDWYQLGGRWRGQLLLKTGEEIDQALVRDVDFREMRNRAEKKAVDFYRKVRAVLGDAPEPRTWDAVRADHPGDIEAARVAFRSQPAYVATAQMQEVNFPYFRGDLNEFYWPESRYIFRARKKAFSTFAVLKAGNWHERGKMGWWCAVHNEKDEDTWLNEFEILIESLTPDTLLSVFDCHI